MSITNFKKIPELVVNDKLANSDVFAVANDTTTSKLTVSQLMVHVKHNAEITSNTIIDHGTTGRLVFRAPTPAAARTVLELGTIAVKNTITISEVDNLSANLAYLQSQITSNDVDIAALQANVTNLNATVVIKGNNLSDIPNKYTARANLGVGYHSDVHFSNLTANGIITSEFSNSTQGGILQLNTPTSGTTLVGGKIRIDSASNQIRFYESGGSHRGLYVDLSLGANNAGTPILHSGNFDQWAVKKTGDVMTGPLRVPTVLFVSAANASESPAFRLTDETGVRRGTVYWDRTSNQVWLVLHDATGAVVNTIRLSATGATIGTSPIWTDANKQIADGRVLGNVSGSTGVPVGVTLSALLDKISNTRGAVLYRGASGWTALGAGAAGQVLTSGGAGADPSWQDTSAGVDALIPPEFVAGLTLSNNGTDANNDIDIAPGRARGSGATVEISSTITKRLDANWSEGDGEGGLDTGSKAANATYHVFVIRKDDDGTGDVLLSTSATSPTVPVGWTRVQRLGAIMTDGSGNIRPFVQDGNEFRYNVSGGNGVSAYGSVAGNRAYSLLSCPVPTGVRLKLILSMALASVSTPNPQDGGEAIFGDGANADVRERIHRWGIDAGDGHGSTLWTIDPVSVRTNTSGQIYFGIQSAHGSYGSQLWVRGWIDESIPRIGK